LSYFMILELLGGVGLFIYGMRQMGEGLQKTAGDKLQRFIELLTSNPLAGVLVGAGVTAIIQSSSATTIMTVGFVNAGLMTLRQAVGIIMGANIGTTITAQLIAFDLGGFSLPAIAIGAFLLFFTKQKRFKQLGQVIFGFGLLFLGMTVMQGSMAPLADSAAFREFFSKFGALPILGILVGAMTTALVQSSSATIGILISLASVGAIDFTVAIPILLGDNIGTTFTAMLSSLGTKLSARRTAMAHMVFNVLGTGVFIVVFYLVPGFSGYLESFFQNIAEYFGHTWNVQRLIANTHTAFNITNTLIWFPFIAFLTNLVIRLIPGKEEILHKGPIYLDERMLKTPVVALEQAHKELLRMADLAYVNVGDSRRIFMDEEENLIDNFFEREEAIDALETKITDYLAKLSRQSMDEVYSARLNNYFHIINDIERIGDHAENIVELAEYKMENKLPFSDRAIGELNNMFDRVMQTIDEGIKSLSTGDLATAVKVLRFEDEVDDLENEYRENHIQRLNEGLCYPGSGIVFVDILSNLERIGDHVSNIAKIMLKDRN